MGSSTRTTRVVETKVTVTVKTLVDPKAVHLRAIEVDEIHEAIRKIVDGRVDRERIYDLGGCCPFEITVSSEGAAVREINEWKNKSLIAETASKVAAELREQLGENEWAKLRAANESVCPDCIEGDAENPEYEYGIFINLLDRICLDALGIPAGTRYDTSAYAEHAGPAAFISKVERRLHRAHSCGKCAPDTVEVGE